MNDLESQLAQIREAAGQEIRCHAVALLLEVPIVGRSQPGAVGFTSVRSRFEEGGYDFLDLSVRYAEDTDAPRDFGGYSGGGVWFVPIQNRQGTLIAERALLSGVAFSQSAIG